MVIVLLIREKAPTVGAGGVTIKAAALGCCPHVAFMVATDVDKLGGAGQGGNGQETFRLDIEDAEAPAGGYIDHAALRLVDVVDVVARKRVRFLLRIIIMFEFAC